jgi:hypothetical protein
MVAAGAVARNVRLGNPAVALNAPLRQQADA